MREPYREPEVPSAVEAERRLAERLEGARAKGAAERAAKTRRARRARHAAIGVTVGAAVVLAVSLVLRAGFGVEHGAVAAALIVSGMATPLGLVFALGMKIPPRPGDAPSGSPTTPAG